MRPIRILMTAMAIALCHPAFADQPAPLATLVRPTADGKHVLIVHAPKEQLRPDAEIQRENQRLLEKHPSSGLYETDPPGRQVWALDDHYYTEVILSTDGDTVLGRFWLSGFAGPANEEQLGKMLDTRAFALSFRGKVIREYRVRELVTHPETMRRSVTRLDWYKSASLVPDESQFRIESTDTVTFIDARTGDMIGDMTCDEQARDLKWWLMGLLAVILLLTLFLRRRRQR